MPCPLLCEFLTLHPESTLGSVSPIPGANTDAPRQPGTDKGSPLDLENVGTKWPLWAAPSGTPSLHLERSDVEKKSAHVIGFGPL